MKELYTLYALLYSYHMCINIFRLTEVNSMHVHLLYLKFQKHHCMTQQETNALKLMYDVIWYKQGKSEGFESWDRPIVRERPIWVKSVMFCPVRPGNLMDDLGKQQGISSLQFQALCNIS